MSNHEAQTKVPFKLENFVIGYQEGPLFERSQERITGWDVGANADGDSACLALGFKPVELSWLRLSLVISSLFWRFLYTVHSSLYR